MLVQSIMRPRRPPPVEFVTMLEFMIAICTILLTTLLGVAGFIAKKVWDLDRHLLKLSLEAASVKSEVKAQKAEIRELQTAVFHAA